MQFPVQYDKPTSLCPLCNSFTHKSSFHRCPKFETVSNFGRSCLEIRLSVDTQNHFSVKRERLIWRELKML
jgi:hypothetical protein